MIESTEKLRKLYEAVYAGGKEEFFSRFVNGRDISETDSFVWTALSYAGKRVLDVGCGTGETAAGIAGLGAISVTGIDYAQSAIEQANARHQADNLRFEVRSLDDWSEPVDVVVSCGTLEHMERPDLELKKMVDLVKGRGEIALTCPYFLNLRGFVWMSLVLLLDVPMSLTDRHFISPFDIEDWLKGTSMRLVRAQSFDYELANGHFMLAGMNKRLKNALCDAGLPNDKVDTTLAWLEKVVTYEARTSPGRFGGANALYLIQPEAAA
jgi:2-polyprenyl-3-methyl-5-hydroxy-6-metoxy-1,4-benzoquinol methylase